MGLAIAILVKILLKKQESSIIKGGNITKYFTWKRDKTSLPNIWLPNYSSSRNGFLLSIKENKNIKRINTFNHKVKTIFKDKGSLIEAMKVSDIFFFFSGCKPNKSKAEVTGIFSLKGANLALCGMIYVCLRLSTVNF